jgi:hypothetical protein
VSEEISFLAWVESCAASATRSREPSALEAPVFRDHLLDFDRAVWEAAGRPTGADETRSGDRNLLEAIGEASPGFRFSTAS